MTVQILENFCCDFAKIEYNISEDRNNLFIRVMSPTLDRLCLSIYFLKGISLWNIKI